MVAPAIVELTESSSSTTNFSKENESESKVKGGTDISPSAKKPTRPATEKLEARGDLLPSTSVPSITGAQISTDIEIVSTDSFLTTSLASASRLARFPARTSSLVELPKVRIVTAFEPHLRQGIVVKLNSLFEDFRDSLDTPAAATAKAELKAALNEAYQRSILQEETRNFATAISILMDFLQPHWAEISAQKLDAIIEKLQWLGSEADVKPRVLEQFYRELAAVVNSRISIILEKDDDVSDEDVEESGADDAST